MDFPTEAAQVTTTESARNKWLIGLEFLSIRAGKMEQLGQCSKPDGLSLDPPHPYKKLSPVAFL